MDTVVLVLMLLTAFNFPVSYTHLTNWVYIDLSERKATTVEIGEEHKSEIPAKWDLAIHRYDIKTNEGSLCLSIPTI